MKTALAIVGGIYVVLAVLGSLGIGNFFIYYGPDKPPSTWCKERGGKDER